MRQSRIHKIIALLTCSPAHELGHIIVAKGDGAEILGWSIIPQLRNGHLMTGYVRLNEFSFSSIRLLILCKLAGLLITFIPSLILYQYFRNEDNDLWHIPFMWVMISPALAFQDFLDIGRILLNPMLGNILSLSASISSVILSLWYLKPSMERAIKTRVPSLN